MYLKILHEENDDKQYFIDYSIDNLTYTKEPLRNLCEKILIKVEREYNTYKTSTIVLFRDSKLNQIAHLHQLIVNFMEYLNNKDSNTFTTNELIDEHQYGTYRVLLYLQDTMEKSKGSLTVNAKVIPEKVPIVGGARVGYNEGIEEKEISRVLSDDYLKVAEQLNDYPNLARQYQDKDPFWIYHKYSILNYNSSISESMEPNIQQDWDQHKNEIVEVVDKEKAKDNKKKYFTAAAIITLLTGLGLYSCARSFKNYFNFCNSTQQQNLLNSINSGLQPNGIPHGLDPATGLPPGINPGTGMLMGFM